MATWRGRAEEKPALPHPLRWPLILLRLVFVLHILLTGLVIKLVLRLVERPLFGATRPITPFITIIACRLTLLVIGLRRHTRGKMMAGAGALVANHSSWLDILTLNATGRFYFVSKAEVAGWPGIGWLAKMTGTVFISRRSRDALTQREIFETRLKAGHRLLFFPEGTSTDGQQVIAFKSTLFAAFFDPALKDEMMIQPVSVAYHPPAGREDHFYGWWGDMDLAPHLLKVLSILRQGSVEILFHDPVRVSDFADRRALAAACEDQVRSAHSRALSANRGEQR